MIASSRLLALLVVLTVACGDDDDGPVPTPPPSGALTVRVAGLPEGIPANVVVTGPADFNRALTGSLVLTDLAAGTYTVTALDVSGLGKGFAGPEAAIDVEVSATQGGVAQVDYVEVEPVIAPDARIADDAMMDSLSAFVRDGSKVTLTFAQATPVLSGLAVGDLLVLDKSEQAPSGLLGRVTRIDGLTVETTDAELDELVQQGVVALDREVTAADVVSVEALNPVGFRSKARLLDPAALVADGVFDAKQARAGDICVGSSVSFMLGDQVSVGLVADGSLCFRPSISFGVNLKLDPSKSSMHFGIAGRLVASMNGTALGQLTVSKAIPIFKVTLATFTVVIGPAPVVITPVVTFYLKADGTITAGITAGAIDTFEFSAGVRIDKNGAAPYRSSSNTFEFVYPKPVATASLKVSAGPSLALLLYGAVGPEMGLFGYAQLDIDFLGDPKWRLHAGIEITVGISLLGGLFNYSATIFNFDKELLTASDPPPPGLERYRFAVPGGVVATPAIGPDDRVIVAGAGGTVYALDGEGAKQWSFFTAVDGIAAQPVIAPDGTIYVMAFDQRLYAITSAGQSKWTVDADYGNLAVAANGTIYTTTTTSLQARDPASGNVLWTANLPAGPSGKPTITAGGDLLVPQFSGTLSAITPAGTERWTKVVADFGLRTPALSPDGATAYVSTNGESRLIAVKVADGAVAWSTPLPNGGEQASPAVVGPDGQIYVGGVARKLIAFSPAGVALWGYQTSGLFKGGAVVGADGNVYAASSDGFIHGLKPSGTFLFRRPTFGFSQASLTMDRRGAVLVPSECTPSAPAQCGVSAVFTGASGLASSWAKEGGDLTNTGRR